MKIVINPLIAIAVFALFAPSVFAQSPMGPPNGREAAPRALQQFVSRALSFDQNSDGQLNQAELMVMAQAFFNQRGGNQFAQRGLQAQRQNRLGGMPACGAGAGRSPNVRLGSGNRAGGRTRRRPPR